MKAIVDTNVLIAANARNCPQANPACVQRCVQLLQKIKIAGILVLDDAWLIIKEYKVEVSQTGQPGVGDAFLKWALVNQANPRHCERISITQESSENLYASIDLVNPRHCERISITPTDENYQFAEFPDDLALAKFDPSDRKFVAVALTHPDRPAIYNAVDSDWKIHQLALEKHGIQIEFLCPDCLKDA